MVANILPQTPTLRPQTWEWGQNSTLSQNGHVPYQIKGNYECINMVANTLTQTPKLPPPQKKTKKKKQQIT